MQFVMALLKTSTSSWWSFDTARTLLCVHVSTGRCGILRKCLTLTCGYKMGNLLPPARSAKLKKIYGSKTSKTADLDTISIQIFIRPHVLCIQLVATLKGAASFQGGRVPPPSSPSLNETLHAVNPEVGKVEISVMAVSVQQTLDRQILGIQED